MLFQTPNLDQLYHALEEQIDIELSAALMVPRWGIKAVAMCVRPKKILQIRS